MHTNLSQLLHPLSSPASASDYFSGSEDPQEAFQHWIQTALFGWSLAEDAQSNTSLRNQMNLAMLAYRCKIHFQHFV